MYIRIMNFEQRIYINDRPLILTNSAKYLMDRNEVAKGYELYIGAFSRNFRMAKKHLERPFVQGVIIEDIDVDLIKKELNQYFLNIQAGGGVVRNANGDVLLILRRGRWDLPKGKLDEGENIEKCAIREVQEETGVKQLHLGSKIMDTFHIYSGIKDFGITKGVLKKTTWFNMTVDGVPDLIPQSEENILQAKWVPVEELSNYILHSYQGIKDVLKQKDLI
ncbi:MAG TPA: NUDIX domain-containing protein [Edaphocola sp.]|nr:NUDIX domain-containing protein [Edaphocola sp.]